MRYPMIATAVTTAALTFSVALVGCGSGGDSATTQTEPHSEETTEQVTNTEESAEDAALDETEKGMVRYNTWFSWYDDYSDDMRNWNYAFAGNTPDGKTVFFAQNAAGTQALIFLLNNDGSYTTYAGNVNSPQNGLFTIYDNYSGHSIDVLISQPNAGGNIFVTIGDVECELVRADINDVINSIDAIEAYNYNMRYF